MWGVYFIGEIINKSSSGFNWILVATNYFTKWVEAILTRRSTSIVFIDFLMNKILTSFGVPGNLIIENRMFFILDEFKNFCLEYGITISDSSPYNPQWNG